MSLSSPITPGIIQATVQFNEDPPVIYQSKNKIEYVFSSKGGGFNAIDTVSGGKLKDLKELPETEDLFGITLAPKQDHWHNFMILSKSATDTSTQFLELGNEVANIYSSSLNSLMWYFTWFQCLPFYNESVAVMTMADYTEYNSNTSTALTDADKIRRMGAKWEMIKKSTPAHSSRTSGSDLANLTAAGSTEFVKNSGVSSIIFPSQVQRIPDGPTGIGVHWGITKYGYVPERMGFYLDFYFDKEISNPTSPSVTDPSKHDPAAILRMINIPALNTLIANAGTNFPAVKDIYKSQISAGHEKDCLFYLVNKSYILINLNNANTLDNLFLLITSDDSPKIFILKNGVIKLLSTYTPNGNANSFTGMKLLKGDNDGRLNLQFRNILGNLIIDNNVIDDPWVISEKCFAPTTTTITATSTIPAANSGTFDVLTTGGTLSVMGGNINCGINFMYLNYSQTGSITLEKLKFYGSNRAVTSSLSSMGCSSMPSDLKTGSVYYPNSASTITDSVGAADLSARKDVLNTYSSIECTGTTSPVGAFTEYSPTITLSTTITSTSYGSYGINMGYVYTPVLQYLSITAEPGTPYVTTTSREIQNIIESIEITRQSDDYNIITSSGSMNVNIWNPSADSGARTEVVNSIGKARYLTIKATNGCSNINTSGDTELFTGIAFNPSLTEEPGKRFLKFELKDFWTILEAKLMINSPFFDGALDTDVIQYLMDYSAFKTAKVNIHTGSTMAFPISFSFQTPQARIEERSNIGDAIKGIAKKYSKLAYFNKKGIFQYIRQPDYLVQLSTGSASFTPVFYFFSSHLGTNTNVIPIGPNHAASSTTSMSSPTSDNQIAYKVKTTQWDLGTIYNKLIIQYVDGKSRGYGIMADANYRSLTDKDSYGFLGYEKVFMQDEAAFGNQERAREILRTYQRFYRPPYTISWQTFGGNNVVDIFDIVSVDGVYVIVNKISHTLNATENSWMTEYSGEWLFPPFDTGFFDATPPSP